MSVVTPKFIHRCSWKGSSLAGDSSWRLVLKLCTRYLKYDWEDANCSHLRKWRLTEMMENYSPLRWPLGSTKGQSQSTRSQERGQHSWPGLCPPLQPNPTAHQSCTPLPHCLNGFRSQDPWAFLWWPPMTPASWYSHSWIESLPSWLWAWPHGLLCFWPMEHWKMWCKQRLDKHSHIGAGPLGMLPFGTQLSHKKVGQNKWMVRNHTGRKAQPSHPSVLLCQPHEGPQGETSSIIAWSNHRIVRNNKLCYAIKFWSGSLCSSK